jgi:hypothetical protein
LFTIFYNISDDFLKLFCFASYAVNCLSYAVQNSDYLLEGEVSVKASPRTALLQSKIIFWKGLVPAGR